MKSVNSFDFNGQSIPLVELRNLTPGAHYPFVGYQKHCNSRKTFVYLISRKADGELFAVMCPIWHFNELDKLLNGKTVAEAAESGEFGFVVRITYEWPNRRRHVEWYRVPRWAGVAK